MTGTGDSHSGPAFAEISPIYDAELDGIALAGRLQTNRNIDYAIAQCLAD